jgi:hypothetical protein
VPLDGQVLDGCRRRSVLPSPMVRTLLPFHLYRSTFLLEFVRAVVRLRPHAVLLMTPRRSCRQRSEPGFAAPGSSTTPRSSRPASHTESAVGRRSRRARADDRLRRAAVISVSPTGSRRRCASAIASPERRRWCATRARCRSAATEGREPASDWLLTRRWCYVKGRRHRRGCEVLVKAVAGPDGVNVAFLGDPEPGYGA